MAENKNADAGKARQRLHTEAIAEDDVRVVEDGSEARVTMSDVHRLSVDVVDQCFAARAGSLSDEADHIGAARDRDIYPQETPLWNALGFRCCLANGGFGSTLDQRVVGENAYLQVRRIIA